MLKSFPANNVHITQALSYNAYITEAIKKSLNRIKILSKASFRDAAIIMIIK